MKINWILSLNPNLLTITWPVVLSWLLVTVSIPCLAEPEISYDRQLQILSKKIDQLQQQLTRDKSLRASLQRDLQRLEQVISAVQEEAAEIQVSITSEKQRLTELKARRAGLVLSRQRQQRQIGHIARQAYALGQESKLKLLLNQENPHGISRLLRYHDYFVDAHRRKLEVYLDTLAKIVAVERSVAATLAQLDTHRAELNQRYRQLQSTQAERLQTLASINADLENKGGALSQLRRDRQRLERLLEEATQALGQLQLPEQTEAFRKAYGKLPYPVDGRVVHSYGSPKLDGRLRWQGLFIAGTAGSMVVSVHRGRVIFADYLRGHGLLLIIDHGDGYMSLYAHNQTLLKETGEWVDRGEPIARLGNTGGQSREGLYFEIRHNGKPQNPRPWFGSRS
jgi:septal ring factor EnvC (AmiA/AmiB activator)